LGQIYLRADGGDMTNAALTRIAESPALCASAIPTVVLDRELRVRGANPAYEQASLRCTETLLGEEVFVAFPDNPADPAGAGGPRLLSSLERVLSARQRHHLGFLRYDISDPDHADVYLPRTWSAVNSPLVENGRVIGILEQVEDVTTLAYGAEIGSLHGDEPADRLAVALANTTATLAAAEDEADQLRTALASSRVIGIAIGIVMSQHCMSREHAFELLRFRSQRSNRKLREIAESIATSGSLPDF
jgi:response regulator NasT